MKHNKKAYARLELLRKLKKFQPPVKDLKKNLYNLYQKQLEQSSNVWNSGLTIQNEKDLERVQKVALKIILDANYKSYDNALKVLELDNLKDKRQHLSLAFARKFLRNSKMKNLFPPNNCPTQRVQGSMNAFKF